MARDPLPAGSCILMNNGAGYIIDELIGRGGFSLVYGAHTAGGTAPVVIKEFFPADEGDAAPIAFRDRAGRVQPRIGCEEIFTGHLNRFRQEGRLGGAVSAESFQALPFLEASEGYAVLPRLSGDMRSFSALVNAWKTEPPLPESGNPADRDPCFPGFTRIGYALRAVDSLLDALSVVHRRGYLHLDLSSTNVFWAGQNQNTGRNCAAFLADFGSAAQITAGCTVGAHQPFSPGFSAPETQEEGSYLTPATDLYSVAMLLFYLCCGDDALLITRNRARQIERTLGRLALPPSVRNGLQQLLLKGAEDDMKLRYQSAKEMQAAVRQLAELLPRRPVNPDNTDGFTLRSLRHLLTGSPDTGCSWADELCDRRGLPRPVPSPSACQALTSMKFSGDEAFLSALLPEPLFRSLIKEAPSPADRAAAPGRLMSGRITRDEIRRVVLLCSRYGFRPLLVNAYGMLDNDSLFPDASDALFGLLGKDGAFLRTCMQRLRVREYPYIGLALLTLFALLGKDGFEHLLVSAQDAQHRFTPL